MSESHSAGSGDAHSARRKPNSPRREYRIDPPHRESPLQNPARHPAVDAADPSMLSGEPQLWAPVEGMATKGQADVPPTFITLSLGQWEMSAETVAQWKPGTQLDCLRQDLDFVDVLANGQRIARGIPMVWQNRLCVRITERFSDSHHKHSLDAMSSTLDR